jgi:mannose/cellobiose epimerase-like protein (N-acyl-D-glucosamine 2-epimerase family)
VRDRLWWPICEGVGAAHFLGNAESEGWYRRFWDFAARHLIDARHGGWFCQLDEELRPIPGYFAGKPDIYHALQACLIPLYGVEGSLTHEIAAAD